MKKWNSNMQFPTDSSFKNRIADVQFTQSKSSGQPMLVLTLEVQEPQEYEINGEMVNIAGVKDTIYLSTQSLDPKTKEIDQSKTDNSRDRIKEIYRRCEQNPDDINWDNIDTKPLKGLLVFTMMSPEEDVQRKNPTAAQLKKDKNAVGDILKHPVSGKPLVKYYPKVREIFGVVPGSERTPF